MIELEITPEPPEGEREAVEAAVTRLFARDGGRVSAWWRAGIEETVLGLDD